MLSAPSINRVLVVDDYQPWRRHIAAALQGTAQWQVVGEVADGVDAVQQAEALAPDLILLDVSLPRLNGIEVARCILARDPSARILFLSEHRSWDIVEEALATGARGYINKSDVARELLPAMETALLGRRVVSTTFTAQVSTSLQPDQPVRATRCHEVGFYADDVSLVGAYVRFAGAALKSGHALVCLADEARRQDIGRQLSVSGIDLDRAIREGRYVALDAAEETAKLMTDGSIDESRFWTTAHQMLQTAVNASIGDRPRVSAFGECAPRLWRSGNASAAVRLEQLWDEVADKYNVDVFCGYHSAGLPHDEDSRVFRKICATHSAVVTGS